MQQPARQEVAAYADYVVVGEGEYTLPLLLSEIEAGRDGHIAGVATRDWYEPAKSSVRLDGYPPFSEVQGYMGDLPRLPVHLRLLPDTADLRALHAAPFDR